MKTGIKDFLIKNPIYLREEYFKKKFPEIYNELNKIKFPDDYVFLRKIYHYINNDIELKLSVCPTCGCEKHFRSFGYGYYEYCSKKCIYTKERTEKCKQTKKERHGDENYNNIKKNKQTCLEKYNVDNISKLDSVKNKKRNKVLNRTNDEKQKFKEKCQNTWKNKSIEEIEKHKEKIRKTKKEKYNDETYVNPEKTKLTKLKNHGDSNYVNPNKAKITKKIKYGDENYNNQQKANQTRQRKYGSIKYRNIQKTKQTKKIKYNDEYYNNREQFKQTLLSAEYIEKQKNKYDNLLEKYRAAGIKCVGGVSEIELLFYEYLVNKFGKDDIRTQYSSNEYPFRCDFYIITLNLYIEINGFWTHGYHAFNKDNKNDIEKLNYWKSKNSRFYKSAINIWTNVDVHKRKIAKENKLNYLEIFSIKLDQCVNEFNSWINNNLINS